MRDGPQAVGQIMRRKIRAAIFRGDAWFALLWDGLKD
jgi:hypothetical protein